MFLAMHILVTPLASQLVEQEAGLDARYIQETLAFPLRGKSLDSASITSQLKRAFRQYVGAEDMNLRNYRQFADALVENLAPFLKDRAALLTAIADSQGAHGTCTTALHYGTASGHTHVLHARDLQQFHAASMVWASFILPDTDFTEEERIDLACARGTQTPSIHEPLPDAPTINTALQAQPALTGQNINTAELARCLAVELRAGNVHTASVPPSTSPLPSSHIVTPVEMEQSTAPLVTRDHKHILRIFTGNKWAEWSSRGQADAFALITERRRGSVLVILPTGAGKSLPFTGTPSLERGVVVVVLPLLSLLEDQKRTAERLKIPVTVWSPRTPSSVPDGLVFISVESVTKMFQTWCVLVQNNGRLTRIVFNEIHKVLEDQAFRDAMLNMHLLIEAAVPLVLLTATLAPTLEPVLLSIGSQPTIRLG
ncbi:DEAD/DEAH box helicase, putative [Rhizoctonia solani AG-1 IB]|uniref:DEAD/DEAH box helicase, putative n=1 Tax=Thanatephorus cucumeris (strain AG1-IB / isolate 7/3/14) TaxID=1108050 RepID=M5CFU8_THACB|nr:DEAD/DEAH box helicase, putative [Rhizoctonia solani AG-1 IB]